MKMEMTSRERVAAVLGHQEPDRAPIDDVANGGFDRRLKAHFGIDPGDNEALLSALQVDFRAVGPTYTGPRLHPEKEGGDVDPVWGVETV